MEHTVKGGLTSIITAASENRQVVMAYCLKWKAQPSAMRICWLMTGAQRRRLSILHQDYPA